MILSGILLIAFFILHLTQSTRTADRIYLYIRIERGQLSNQDIVNISHRLATDRQWYNKETTPYHIWNDTTYSRRYYLSANGRIYNKVIMNDHQTVIYESRKTALTMIKYFVGNSDLTNKVITQSRKSYTMQTLKPALIGDRI